MQIAIVGSGNMARGIGSRVVATKHELTIYDRELDKAKKLASELGANVKAEVLGEQVGGDILILATPYMASQEIVAKYKKAWQSKVVVDISNPVDFQTFKLLPPPGSSGAEEIAKQGEGLKIVKAFNTVFAGVLQVGNVDGKRLDVMIAGDDAEAKKQVTQLVVDMGMRALDVGPLANARHLEGFQLLHMGMQAQLGNNWMSAIKILPE